MTVTDPAPTDPPAAGSAWGERWGVFHRVRGSRRWVLLTHAGSEAAAWRLMLDVMPTMPNSDWSVRRLQEPPQDAANAAPPGSAAASAAIGRQRRSLRDGVMRAVR